jgi:hypothetical protein
MTTSIASIISNLCYFIIDKKFADDYIDILEIFLIVKESLIVLFYYFRILIFQLKYHIKKCKFVNILEESRSISLQDPEKIPDSKENELTKSTTTRLLEMTINK